MIKYWRFSSYREHFIEGNKIPKSGYRDWLCFSIHPKKLSKEKRKQLHEKLESLEGICNKGSYWFASRNNMRKFVKWSKNKGWKSMACESFDEFEKELTVEFSEEQINIMKTF